ncbi:MAG: AI-2E family transporter, partial [Oscillospiraceae bacterium]|nr:AI-2E family transporter [Oscillospiraceae bacterium]
YEVCLQQIDGNIIGPRILGGRLGISDFWILVSITVFGSVFGFPGMLMGVPVFTIIYTLSSEAINKALRKKQLSEETMDYYPITAVEDLNKSDKPSDGEEILHRDDHMEKSCNPEKKP